MNVFTNGSLYLLCVKGEGQPEATFIRAIDGELIFEKASGCVWRNGRVEWRSGYYCGHIADNLKEDANEKDFE